MVVSEQVQRVRRLMRRQRLLLRASPLHGDTNDWRAAKQVHAGYEAALRAAAAGSRHDSLEFQSCCGCLVQDLLGANRIAEIAQPTTAADRYAVRLSSFRAQRLGARGHALLADLMRFENMQARAEQAVEQHVPIVQIGFSGVAATTQDQFAIQVLPGAGGCGLARMV